MKRCRVYFGGAFAVGALIITWLFNGESSPLYEYFLYHVGLKNL